jgi:hypothetical protein
MRSDSLSRFGVDGIAAVAVELALDLTGMRRHQQDAIADQTASGIECVTNSTVKRVSSQS